MLQIFLSSFQSQQLYCSWLKIFMHINASRSLTQPCLPAYTLCQWSKHIIRVCSSMHQMDSFQPSWWYPFCTSYAYWRYDAYNASCTALVFQLMSPAMLSSWVLWCRKVESTSVHHSWEKTRSQDSVTKLRLQYLRITPYLVWINAESKTIFWITSSVGPTGPEKTCCQAGLRAKL